MALGAAQAPAPRRTAPPIISSLSRQRCSALVISRTSVTHPLPTPRNAAAQASRPKPINRVGSALIRAQVLLNFIYFFTFLSSFGLFDPTLGLCIGFLTEGLNVFFEFCGSPIGATDAVQARRNIHNLTNFGSGH